MPSNWKAAHRPGKVRRGVGRLLGPIARRVQGSSQQLGACRAGQAGPHAPRLRKLGMRALKLEREAGAPAWRSEAWGWMAMGPTAWHVQGRQGLTFSGVVCTRLINLGIPALQLEGGAPAWQGAACIGLAMHGAYTVLARLVQGACAPRSRKLGRSGAQAWQSEGHGRGRQLASVSPSKQAGQTGHVCQ